jgi:hypothetical protein
MEVEMSKYDQKILKFLNQHPDRTTTITDLMTRLNISISDIGESLNSLLEQGLIGKRTNSHSIECWFPISVQNTELTMPTTQMEAMKIASETRLAMPLVEMQAESPYTESAPRAEPVAVRHIEAVERQASQTRSFPSIAPMQPVKNTTIESIGTGVQGYNFQQQSAKGVGFLTFIIGLILAMGFSTWMTSRLTTNEIRKASKTFVDQKSLSEANATFLEFQTKTKTHILTLQDQVKKLNEQLATSQSVAESLKVAAVALPPPKTPSAKEEKADRIAKTKEKAKIAKKAKLVRSSKSVSSLTKSALARTKSKTPEVTSDYTAPTARVPEPPGLENEDLPPPPSAYPQ